MRPASCRTPSFVLRLAQLNSPWGRAGFGVSTTESRSPLFGSDVGIPTTALVMLSLLRDSVLTTPGDIGGSAIVASEDLQVAKRPVAARAHGFRPVP
jgi:hypothetical protein